VWCYRIARLRQLTLILTPHARQARSPLQLLERGSEAAVKSTLHSGERFGVGKNAQLRNIRDSLSLNKTLTCLIARTPTILLIVYNGRDKERLVLTVGSQSRV